MPIEKIESLIDGNGCIAIGAVEPIQDATSAADEDQCLAMLITAKGKPLMDLLRHLDAAIDDAYENQVFAEEVNS